MQQSAPRRDGRVVVAPSRCQRRRRLASPCVWLLLQLPCGHGFGTLFKAMFNRSSSSSSCVDDTDSCREWAAAGECIANPEFMLSSCARSCGKCDGVRAVERRPRRPGCADEADYGCAARAARGECDSDKGEMLFRCPESCRVCQWSSLLREALGCEDSDGNCANWARHGECHANPAFMLEKCANACGGCASKRKSCDRPPNTPPAVTPGGINQTMVRILRDFPQYRPRALSWPGGPKGAQAPWEIGRAHV